MWAAFHLHSTFFAARGQQGARPHWLHFSNLEAT